MQTKISYTSCSIGHLKKESLGIVR